MWRVIMHVPRLWALGKSSHIYNFLKQVKRSTPIKFFALGATGNFINLEDYVLMEHEPELEVDNIRLGEELKFASQKNDEAIRNLIKTLNCCIEEICEQYQHCIAKQIEITLVCMGLSPLAKQWDELTKYRVEANDLKFEFEKYMMLIERMSQIIENQVHSTLFSGNHNHLVSNDYKILKNLIVKKCEENLYWDNKLLDINKQSILSGVL